MPQTGLFDTQITRTHTNILTRDGTAHYYGPVYPPEVSHQLFEVLLSEIPWQHDEVKLFGKVLTTKRKMAWFADGQLPYTYSGSVKHPEDWHPQLLRVREHIEDITGETYNSCLLNLYHSGEEAMGWHADNEKEMKKGGAIASLSLGAARKFAFKHRHAGDRVDVFLENGSLLVMKDETQDFWLHRLPPTKKIKAPRINLTFRTISG